MGKMLSFLILILSASVALPALGEPNVCDKGDTLMGPNCVHTYLGNIRGMNYTFSVVYRVNDSEKTTVWSDQGEVEKSTKVYLIVSQLVQEKDGEWGWGPVRYNWSAKLNCYARSGGCYL